jgi:hypothetical protein
MPLAAYRQQQQQQQVAQNSACIEIVSLRHALNHHLGILSTHAVGSLQKAPAAAIQGRAPSCTRASPCLWQQQPCMLMKAELLRKFVLTQLHICRQHASPPLLTTIRPAM